LAFLRLATRSSIFPHPLTLEEATSQVQDWITAPGTAMIEPLPDHARVLTAMLRQADAGGNLVNDAHLAALALSHRADLVSYDSDFERFRELRRFRPDDLLA
ncbi:MAG: PIN domain-containing protein, partial [Jatrophihabitans sp.]